MKTKSKSPVTYRLGEELTCNICGAHFTLRRFLQEAGPLCLAIMLDRDGDGITCSDCFLEERANNFGLPNPIVTEHREIRFPR